MEEQDRFILIRQTAHDVRTPLTSIAGFAELIIEDESLPGGARENAQVILDETRRLSEILDQFFNKMRADEE